MGERTSQAVLERWSEFLGVLRHAELEAFPRFFAATRLRAIGTDPEEWWYDAESLVGTWQAQCREIGGGFPFVSMSPEAFVEGDVAWVSDRLRMELPGQSVPCRVTAVWVVEDDSWRIVQWHLSLGLANETAISQELTTSAAIAEEVMAKRPDLAPAVGAHGHVTIAFTDIENSTVWTEKLGDLEWVRVLGEHDEFVRRGLRKHHGFEVKSLGDGFMLAFADVGDAARFALELQSEFAGGDTGELRIRAGLHRGDAIRQQGDFECCAWFEAVKNELAESCEV